MPNMGNAVATLSSFYDKVGPEVFSFLVASHALPGEVEEALEVVRESIKAQISDDEEPDLCIVVIY